MSTENEGNEVSPAPSAPPASPSAPSPAPSAPASGAGAGVGAAPEPGAQAADENVTAPLPPVAAGETAQLPPVPPSGHESGAHIPPPGAHTPPPGAHVPPPGQHTPSPPAGGGADWPPQPPATPSYAQGAGGHGGTGEYGTAAHGAAGHLGHDPAGHGTGGYGAAGQQWGAAYQPAPMNPKSRKGGLIAAALAAALVAGGVGGGVGYWAAERNDGGTNSTTVSASDIPADLKREPGSVAAIAAKALPSVVTIDAVGGNGEGGTGTGFVYDREGHILTNNHVVATAAQGGRLSATFSNGKKYEAEVIGRAQGYDVAVLKLKNADDLKPLPLGNSDKVAVGDATIAIGAPFGLSNTVTTGIVSAKNRPVASSDGGPNRSYMSALQTDASINPGNSGGPLLDARGAVIGINSAIQSAGSGMGGQQAGSIGLGFAIPINQAKYVAKQLIEKGEATYPMIGASVSIDETSRDGGARITQQGAGGTEPVMPGGPADKAGLKPGDLITKLDDRPIDSGPTLISEIWTHRPGETVKLTYERDGKEHTVDVTLGSKGEEN